LSPPHLRKRYARAQRHVGGPRRREPLGEPCRSAGLLPSRRTEPFRDLRHRHRGSRSPELHQRGHPPFRDRERPRRSPPSGALKILAISGSLRAVSSNTALLRAAAILAPPGVEIDVYGGLGDLPHLNPDLEG